MRRFASVSGADVPVIDVPVVADLVDTAIDPPHYRK